MRKFFRVRVRFVAMGGAAMCAMAGMPFAFAQTGDQVPPEMTAPPSNDVDIVVTAQGRVERLQDVPLSATVASGAALERANVRGLEELAAKLPNVKITTSPTSDFINIRGVGSSANGGFEQSVATFVDGLYRGRSRSSRSAMFDVDRVEVLRGPQTTFFGNNAIAGAISVTTRKPGRELAGSIRGFYAPNFEDYSVEGGIDLPASDTLSFRFAGRATGMGGYVHNRDLGVDGPDLSSQNLRLSARWEPADDVEIDARIDYGRQDDKNNFNVELTGCAPDPAFGAARGGCARYIAGVGAANVDDRLDWNSDAAPSFFKQDFVEAQLNVSLPVGTHTLILNSGYYTHDNHLSMDITPVPGAYRSPLARTRFGVVTNYKEEFEQFSQEARLRSPQGQAVEYLAGLYFSHTKANWDNTIGYFFADLGAAVGHPGDPVGVRTLNDESSQTFSGFAALTLNLVDNLKINLAGRYTTIHKSANRTPLAGYTSDGQPLSGSNFVEYDAATQARLNALMGQQSGNFEDPKRTDSKFMPSIGVQYNVAPDVMIYASYTKGFKAGGYSVQTVNSSFDPEEVDNFEVGIKSTFLDRRVRFDLALFHGDYKNLQESVTTVDASGVSIGRVANVASSIAKGVEARLEVRPAQGLTLSTDVAYLDSHYSSYANAPCTQLQVLQRPAPCVQDLSGVRRAFSPKWSGNAAVDYETPIVGNIELRLQGSVYFSSFYFLNPVADRANLAQEGFAKLDARIAAGPEDGAWEVAIVGKNLNNRVTASYALAMPGAAGSFVKLADPGRSVGMQVSAKF